MAICIGKKHYVHIHYMQSIFLIFKMAITEKIEVRISSNLLHSISTSICIRKCNKNWGSFLAIFWKKAWAIVQ